MATHGHGHLSRPIPVQHWTGLEGLAPLNQVQIVPVDQVCPISCAICLGAANRSFQMSMSQPMYGVVMVFERPVRLQGGLKGCFCCCLGQNMEIEGPPGRRIASISEDCNIWGTSLTIRDAKGVAALKVIGPTLPPYICCTNEAVFQVLTMAGTSVGVIRTNGRAIVSFPVNLDVYLKGCLIACSVLISYMFSKETCTFDFFCWCYYMLAPGAVSNYLDEHDT
ncbi:phospholipid scramblase 3-like isoform X2 [Ornithodoros turicata]|uniref:phospholipid scramblase 3-like isoform X2 n=1 Tax=Ornithodoros turicata TaxID=34597 RepID=UPI0031395EBB